MVNWDDYRFLLTVARERTLKRAANLLKVDQATVGRRIAALQGALGSTLLEKRSHGYFLTNSGERIFEMAEKIEKETLAIERAVLGKDNRAEGSVKITMPGTLANEWLIGRLSPLLRAHPGLELQFLTGPELLNLSRREADLAIRLVRPAQRELKARKLASVQLALYGAKEFAGKLGTAPFVGLLGSAISELETAFIESLEFTPKYCLRMGAWSAVQAALLAGAGVGVLPTFIGDKSKGLRMLKKDRAETPLWLVVHPEIAQSTRVRLTIECLTEAFATA